MTNTLIVMALFAWCTQIILSWLQIRRFNHAFSSMKRSRYLGVGRSKNKHFKPRVLIALSLDENQIVIDSVIMKGITVFAKPKPISQLHGLSVLDIIPEKVFPSEPSSQSALIVALTANK